MAETAQANPFLALLWVVAVFVAVAALAVYALRFLSRRWPGAGQARHLRLLEQLHLGPQRHVCLVEAPGCVLVLGVAERSIDVLAVIDDPDLLAALRPAPSQPGTSPFASQLQRLLGRLAEPAASERQDPGHGLDALQAGLRKLRDPAGPGDRP